MTIYISIQSCYLYPNISLYTFGHDKLIAI